MENQKNDNLNMLEAIVQNTEMGKNTLDQLVPMAEDEQFKAELLRQRNIYRQLNQEAHAGMGVVDCIKSQKDYPDAAPGSKRLMQKLQDFEEDNRLKLEQYL